VGEDPPEDDVIAGDIEQSSKGTLLRWIKRPSRNPKNSVRNVGLPLEKFQMWVEGPLAHLFPEDTLCGLQTGFCFAVSISPREDEQRFQLKAIDDYEDAALLWKALMEDRVAPPDDDSDSNNNPFEQAQLAWAYEEAMLKLKAAIEVLVRWRRAPTYSSPPTPRSAVEMALLNSDILIEEKRPWTIESQSYLFQPQQEPPPGIDLPDTTYNRPTTTESTSSSSMNRKVTDESTPDIEPRLRESIEKAERAEGSSTLAAMSTTSLGGIGDSTTNIGDSHAAFIDHTFSNT